MKSEKPTARKPIRRPSYLVVLLLILLIFPVLIAQAWFYVRYAQDALQSELNRTLSRARTLAVAVEQDCAADKMLLQSIADRPMFREALERRDWETVDRHLEDARRYQPEFLFAAAFDLKGTAVRSAPDDPFVGQNFAFRDWYRGVTSKWEPYISEVYRTQMRTKELVVAVAAPIQNAKGEPEAILMAAVSLERLARAIERTQYGVPGEPYIVDHRGNVVAPVDAKAIAPVAAPEPESVREALAGREVSLRTGRRSDGYVLSAAPIAGVGWAVLYRRPVRVALANVLTLRADMSRVYTYLLLLFLTSAGAVHWQVRKQRKLHDTLAESEESLRQQSELLQARTRQLEAANHELEAFTYSVSHDLRAPLRHINGFASILQEDHAGNLPAEARGYLDRITHAAGQMGRLIDDLLNLARVGRKELARQPVELEPVVRAALGDVEREAAGRRIEWKIAPLPQVMCDPGLARQIFVNLLSNSVKYSRPRENAVIEVGQAQVNGSAAIFVRDNGVGFDMKYAHKLFGVFQRLHRVEDFEGTGVGLAIVQRIVHKHGGKIWAEAELDKGATFFFTLGGGEFQIPGSQFQREKEEPPMNADKRR